MIDVVICTKDRPDEVERCLASLARQTRAPRRVLLIDAGREAPAVDSFPGLPLERIPAPAGLPRQRNNGLARVTADLVAFLDDDVEVAPNYLAVLADWFDSHPKAVGASANTPGDPRRPLPSRLYRRVFSLANDDGTLRQSGDIAYLRHPAAPTRVEVLPGHNMIYRTSSIQELRFDESLGTYGGEDADFALRAARTGELWMIPRTWVIHHHAKTARVPSEEFVRQVIVTSAYLFAKNKRMFALSWPAYVRRLVGRLLAYGILSAASGSSGPARGAAAGLRDVPQALTRGFRGARER